MEPIDYLRILRRRWLPLAICVVLAAAAGWITAGSRAEAVAPEYVAAHTMLRDQRSNEFPPALPTISLYIKTGEVPRRVAERLDFEGNPALLVRSLSVEFDEVVGTVTIVATALSPEEAAELANLFAEETLALLAEQATDARQELLDSAAGRLAQLQVDIEALEATLEELEDADPADPSGEPGGDATLLEAQLDAKVRQYGAALDQQRAVLDQPSPSAGYASLESASPELAQVKDESGFGVPSSRPVRSALGAFLGLLLGIGVVLLVERVDPRLNTRPATEDAFNLPVVAEIPNEPPSSRAPYEIRSEREPASGLAEGYRALRAWLLLMPRKVLDDGGAARRRNGDDPRLDPGREPQVILVTSPGPGDGKSTTVANLAVAFAETNRRVLVLGCDFRRPAVHRYFGAPASPGLSELMEGKTELGTLKDVVRLTAMPLVRIAPQGSGLLNLGDVAQAAPILVEEARALADIVLIDTTPLLAATDVLEFVPSADAVVLVCRAGRTTAEAATRARDMLDRLGAHVVGVALIQSAGQDTYSYEGTHDRSRWRRRRSRKEVVPAARDGVWSDGRAPLPDGRRRRRDRVER